MNNFIKSPEQIKKMRIACQLAAKVLTMIERHVLPGVSTKHLDTLCHDYIVNELQVEPSTLGHHGFPGSICTSLNHVVCHGIPSERQILQTGDILNIDVTVKKDGFIGDTSKMFFVGNAKPHAKRLVSIAQQCLYEAAHSSLKCNT